MHILLLQQCKLCLSGIAEKTLASPLNIMISQIDRPQLLKFSAIFLLVVKFKILHLKVLKKLLKMIHTSICARRYFSTVLDFGALKNTRNFKDYLFYIHPHQIIPYWKLDLE